MAEKEIIQMQNNDYNELLLRAVAVIEKTRTDVARHIAIAASNTYWEIGKLLYEKKLESRHGSQVVKRLSADLKERFPKMGMSPRNLWYMKTFFERYKTADAKVQRAVALWCCFSEKTLTTKIRGTMRMRALKKAGADT